MTSSCVVFLDVLNARFVHFLIAFFVHFFTAIDNDSIEVMHVVHASKRLYGLAKFTFYAISDGLAEIFSKSYVGLQAFFRKPDYSPQLSLFDCA